MKLSDETVNGLVNDLAAKMNGGTLCIYEGTPPDSPKTALAPFTEPLVEVALGNPAFDPAAGLRALLADVPAMKIAKSGKAGWARISVQGVGVADLTIAEAGSIEAFDVDLVLKGEDGLNLARGGPFSIGVLALRLPSSL